MTGNIQKYFSVYAEYYENYKEITSLMGACDTLLHDASMAERIRKMDSETFCFMTGLVKKAQENKEILKRIISPEDLAYILLGSFYEVIRMWRMQEYSFSLKSRVNDIISNIVAVYAEKRR